MNKVLIFSVLLLISLNCFAQYENETHVFWQPNNKLSFDMFKGVPSDSSYIQRLKNLNIYHQIEICTIDMGYMRGIYPYFEEKPS